MYSNITPCMQVRHPPNPQLAGPPKKYEIEEGVDFKPVDYQTWPIGCGGVNQREPLASPDSPSSCASVDMLLGCFSCAREGQCQSHCNHRRGNSRVKAGYQRHWAIYLTPIDPPVCAAHPPSTKYVGEQWG